jgi:hypothetical protein
MTKEGRAAAGGFVVVIVILGIVFKEKFLAIIKAILRRGNHDPVSLDDIPLDELEMPWHRWDNQ